ncbi:glycine zipper domain-containing protein [Gemmata sp.]|uniref:glycine zipper domain-containing protein n=1 Tax=Gemmata sp. TaxID=1914242 RepID=UPI003F72A839
MRANRALRAGVLAAAVGGLGSTGCSTMNNTEKGAVAGGAIGTGVGLLAGAATGNPRTGAAVGGLLGGGLGAVAGNEQDRKDERTREVIQAQAVAGSQAQRMGLTDVIHMAQQGHDDQVIINQIRSTGSSFQLTASDLDFLKNNSVSARVIAEMQSARPVAAPTRVIVREAPTVIYQEPVFGPPVYLGPPRPVIYGGYYRRW